MTVEENAAKEAAAKDEAEAKAKAEADAKALQNEAIKKELDKQAEKKRFTDEERVRFNLKKNAERAKELGIDPSEVLGESEEDKDDEVPEWYKREKAKDAHKTALQLAEEVTDKDERELTIEYLSSRIVPSGDPEADFRLAFSAVRALKNKQILEDVQRKSSPRRTAAGGSANAKPEGDVFEPTSAEEKMMQPPWNLSKEKILEARKRTQEKAR